mmetsp:Transcript_16381/g.40566  ORF Transcript_16381/g.40566 Transcript_16381/m.40566 type:complete len:214 (-) Transcript_16381:203-844(-)
MGRPWAAARASSLAGAAGVDKAVEVHQHAGQVVRSLVEVLAAFRARVLAEGCGAPRHARGVGVLRRDQLVHHLVIVPQVPHAVTREHEARLAPLALGDPRERHHLRLGLPRHAVVVRVEVAQAARHRDRLLLDRGRMGLLRPWPPWSRSDGHRLTRDDDEREAVVARVLEHHVVLVRLAQRIGIQLGEPARVATKDVKLLKVRAVVHELEARA